MIISLGICALALAKEYKIPDIEVRDISPSYKEMKAADFSNEYKMEGPAKADRQIASGTDESDREPSSLNEHKKAVKNTPIDVKEPKQWLYKKEHDN